MRVDHKKEPQVAAFIGLSYIALSALAMELLLKTLHALHSENPVPQLHDLGALFRGLDAGTKRSIQRCWDPVFEQWKEKWQTIRLMLPVPQTEPMSPLVAIALDAAAKAFERARYNFDGKAELDYYVDELRRPLIALIVSDHPELGTWRVSQIHTPWGNALNVADEATKKPG